MILKKAGSGYNLFEADSKSELVELCDKKQLTILGLDTEGVRKYYLIEIQREETDASFGLLNAGHGIVPTIVLIENRDRALISSDNQVYFVNLMGSLDSRRVLLDSLVYDIREIHSDDMKIIVVCELEVRCLSVEGEFIWRYDSEIISDYQIFEDHLELIINDKIVMIDIKDGRIIEPFHDGLT